MFRLIKIIPKTILKIIGFVFYVVFYVRLICNSKTIIISQPFVSENDAIGWDVINQYRILRKLGYNLAIICDSCSKTKDANDLVVLKKSLFERIIKRENLILLYHHSSYWEYGQYILDNIKGIMIIKYHNITPSEYFRGYSNDLETNCIKGRLQTMDFVKSNKVKSYICDSKYNADEIAALGVDRSVILVAPPFNKIEDYLSIPVNEELSKTLKNKKNNLLFVGRIMPHKGHKHLIEIVRTYKKLYDENIYLNIIGSTFLEGYYRELLDMIKYNELTPNIEIIRALSFEQLATYYKSSDIFVLTSEHEGFCVPILEAQINRLPIIALKRCAVGETLGMGGSIIEDVDYNSFALEIRHMLTDEQYRDNFIKKGINNVLKYTPENNEQSFLKAFNTALLQGKSL